MLTVARELHLLRLIPILLDGGVLPYAGIDSFDDILRSAVDIGLDLTELLQAIVLPAPWRAQDLVNCAFKNTRTPKNTIISLAACTGCVPTKLVVRIP